MVGEGVGWRRPVGGAPNNVSGTEKRRRRGGALRRRSGTDAPVRRSSRDRGTTFVEVLVSIVLLGTVVGSTLTALRTTIISSERDETQAKAHAALLAAEDALHRAAYEVCGSPAMDDIVGDYSTAVGLATLPAGWTAAVTYVRMWGRDPVSAVEMWRDTCTSGANSAQLVTVIVRSPSGEVGKTIQVVKRD